MGFIQELRDFTKELVGFYTVVSEYEQGLYFRKGVAVERRIKKNNLKKKDLEEIITEEKKVIKQIGKGYEKLGYLLCTVWDPQYPEGYKKSFLGLPRHPKRHDKILQSGLYIHFPRILSIDKIVVESKQEKVLDLGYIAIPTDEVDSKAVLLSCNIRYELRNIYKAYTVVDEYEDSLKDHTLSILAKFSRGKKYDDWKKTDTIDKLQKEVLEELRKIVTDEWGLKIHEIYITHNVAANIQYLVHEGSAIEFNDKRSMLKVLD